VAFAINTSTVPVPTLTLTDYYSNPVTYIAGYGLGNVAGATNLPVNNTLYISESGFSGPYTVGGTCSSYVTLNVTNNNGSGFANVVITPTALSGPGGCNITVSDGTTTITLPTTVTTTTVAPIS
jgi:hypothetical protein